MPGNKSKATVALGKSLMKSKHNNFSSVKKSSHIHEQAQHNDPSNLKSVTELNSLDEFLASADLMGTEFTAEKLNIHYIQPSSVGVLSQQELKNIEKAQNEYVNDIRIPRRPHWDENFTKEALEKAEKDSFINWRRNLAEISKDDNITLTPFEKNLEFWRQLWRVIERSDLVVQIVDARDPLLYRCEDLENYVIDVDKKKKNMILINKSDLLSKQQRQIWFDYFKDKNIPVAFFSAVHENERLTKLEKESVDTKTVEADVDLPLDPSQLLTRNQLIKFFQSQLNPNVNKPNEVITIGMVGYPNVGKSSTINTVLRSKKVSVSATPGRTKHFQTLFITDNMQFCDCPGLVFPSFVVSQAEMILSGILPIDEMRNHVPAVNLLCQKISRKVLEATYGINIVKPREGEDINRPPNAFELLNAYGYMRGFMTSHGQPDHPRSARVVLKDYVNGKLIFSHSPPTVVQDDYSKLTPSVITQAINLVENNESNEEVSLSENILNTISIETAVNKVKRANNQKELNENKNVDGTFFKSQHNGPLTKGRNNNQNMSKQGEKSWKKHNNKKKEKARKVRREMDEEY